MVSRRALSAAACVTMGLGCIGGVMRAHPDGAAAPGATADAAKAGPAVPAPPARFAPAPSASIRMAAEKLAGQVDTELPTGSIAPGSAVHVPNPAAYKGAPKMGDPVTVSGAEAINYLAGNTLRREGPGEPLHFTYFASRGLTGEGDERGFTARRWDRELPELCEPGAAGVPLCRSVTILLDGIYEFPGARLGTVTLGAAGGLPAATAELVKGNAMHFPEHIPFLDSAVDAAAADEGAPPRGGDPVAALAGRSVAIATAGARGRQIAYYAKDDRRFELQQVQAGDGKAVQVTVGHWHSAKAGLCQSRAAGAPQTCFKVEAAEGGMRLVPTGRTGDAQTLTVLPEANVREVAQD